MSIQTFYYVQIKFVQPLVRSDNRISEIWHFSFFFILQFHICVYVSHSFIPPTHAQRCQIVERGTSHHLTRLSIHVQVACACVLNALGRNADWRWAYTHIDPASDGEGVPRPTIWHLCTRMYARTHAHILQISNKQWNALWTCHEIEFKINQWKIK